MTGCRELKTLMDRLDELELELSRATNNAATGRLQIEIADVIDQVRSHREYHTGCDFHPALQ